MRDVVMGGPCLRCGQNHSAYLGTCEQFRERQQREADRLLADFLKFKEMKMGTRCKVRCINTRQIAGSIWDGTRSVPAIIHESQFTAVTGEGSDENKQFFASTPNVVLSVGTTREGHFEAGKHYYLDFTPAES